MSGLAGSGKSTVASAIGRTGKSRLCRSIRSRECDRCSGHSEKLRDRARGVSGCGRDHRGSSERWAGCRGRCRELRRTRPRDVARPRRSSRCSTEGHRLHRELNRMLRAAFLAGDEQQFRAEHGRGLTEEELLRVMEQHPGDLRLKRRPGELTTSGRKFREAAQAICGVTAVGIGQSRHAVPATIAVGGRPRSDSRRGGSSDPVAEHVAAFASPRFPRALDRGALQQHRQLDGDGRRPVGAGLSTEQLHPGRPRPDGRYAAGGPARPAGRSPRRHLRPTPAPDRDPGVPRCREHHPCRSGGP